MNFGNKFGCDPRRRACGNCEKAERSLRGSFQAAVGIRVVGGFPSAASVSTGLPFFRFFRFGPSFLSWGRSPHFRQKMSRQDRLAATIGNSVDPQHPRFLSLLRRISLFQSSSPLAADRLQGNLGLLLCAVMPSLLFHLPSPTGSGSRVETGLLIHTSLGGAGGLGALRTKRSG